jgi:hypothetical protein
VLSTRARQQSTLHSTLFFSTLFYFLPLLAISWSWSTRAARVQTPERGRRRRGRGMDVIWIAHQQSRVPWWREHTCGAAHTNRALYWPRNHGGTAARTNHRQRIFLDLKPLSDFRFPIRQFRLGVDFLVPFDRSVSLSLSFISLTHSLAIRSELRRPSIPLPILLVDAISRNAHPSGRSRRSLVLATHRDA